MRMRRPTIVDGDGNLQWPAAAPGSAIGAHPDSTNRVGGAPAAARPRIPRTTEDADAEVAAEAAAAFKGNSAGATLMAHHRAKQARVIMLEVLRISLINVLNRESVVLPTSSHNVAVNHIIKHCVLRHTPTVALALCSVEEKKEGWIVHAQNLPDPFCSAKLRKIQPWGLQNQNLILSAEPKECLESESSDEDPKIQIHNDSPLGDPPSRPALVAAVVAAGRKRSMALDTPVTTPPVPDAFELEMMKFAAEVSVSRIVRECTLDPRLALLAERVESFSPKPYLSSACLPDDAHPCVLESCSNAAHAMLSLRRAARAMRT